LDQAVHERLARRFGRNQLKELVLTRIGRYFAGVEVFPDEKHASRMEVNREVLELPEPGQALDQIRKIPRVSLAGSDSYPQPISGLMAYGCLGQFHHTVLSCLR
jgi:hypothetical protein